MIKRHPVVSFIALAYLITWPFWILGFVLAERAGTAIGNEDNFHHISDLIAGSLATDRLLALLVYYLGQFGPVLSAFIVTAAIYGGAGVRDLAARVLRWRVPSRWYFVVLVLPLVLVVASLAAAFVTGGFRLGPFSPKVAWVSFVPFVLYMIVFTGLAEEPGWRGFALPHLQAERTAIRSSWILGVLWGVWHIPFLVYFNRDQPLVLIPAMIGALLGIVGWTIVNTWVYNNTESVFLIILLHGWNGAVQSYLVNSQPNPIAWTLFSVVPWGIAAYLSRRYGAEHLGDAPRPKWWPGRFSTEQRGDAGRADLPAQAALPRLRP